jgi:phage terminase large subunit
MLIEMARRQRARKVINILDHEDNFQQQRDFINHPSKLKALFCTRRSAKSYTAGLYMVHEALRTPGCNILFIGLTRDSAKAIIWKDVLREIDRKHNLGALPNKTDLTMTFPNGSVIKVTGVDAEEDEMKKLLGRKHRLVCIDEASMYTVDTRNLVYGILKPGVADPDAHGERGTICMFGTASDFPRGLFFDITKGEEKGWELFQWTAHDNPHVAKQWAEELEDIKNNRPLYMETPQFKQWYLNHWVIDENKLVYRFNPDRNLIKPKDFTDLTHRLDPDGWSIVLGGDTGWEDDNALVNTAYHVNDPRLFVLTSWSQKKLTFDQFSDRITSSFMADKEWSPNRVVIDGANKQGVESMRQRSNIPFEYADKQDKATFIELCNADLVQGKVVFLDIPENRPLWQEMMALVWVTDGDKVKIPKKEHPALPNHRCDAFLYAWRNGYHYQSSPKEVRLVVGSKEWYESQAVDIWNKERERLISEQQRGDWPTESDGW